MSSGTKQDLRRILVVDDDPDITEQLTLLLKGEGYEVAVAGGQEEAERVLLSFKPDLAVVDLMMEQDDSGFILCHEIKKLYPDTPVILLTSVKAATGLSFDTVSADQQSWVEADRILDKPVRPEQLKAQVRRLLVPVKKE
jgi:two-component system, OmpR family, response regulator